MLECWVLSVVALTKSWENVPVARAGSSLHMYWVKMLSTCSVSAARLVLANLRQSGWEDGKFRRRQALEGRGEQLLGRVFRSSLGGVDEDVSKDLGVQFSQEVRV